MPQTHGCSPYIAIARLNRWSINVFMLTGVFFALCIEHHPDALVWWRVLLAFSGLCCAAFANYCINEWYDAPYDVLHPQKKDRPGAMGLIKAPWVWCEYAFLAALGVFCEACVDARCVWVLASFLLAGLCYNIPPIRLKDMPFLDVLSESLNHPLRFLLGWSVVSSGPLPWMLLLACWMLGSYLMTLKRFSEFRLLKAHEGVAAAYRRSFSAYTQKRLLVLCAVYAAIMLVTFSMALVAIDALFYAVIPFMLLLLVWYSRIGCQADSPVQHPETLYRTQPLFMLLVILVLVGVLILLYRSAVV